MSLTVHVIIKLYVVPVSRILEIARKFGNPNISRNFGLAGFILFKKSAY